MKEPVYKPHELLAVGEQFIDLTVKARFIKIGNVHAGSNGERAPQPKVGEAFSYTAIHGAALEPFTHEGRRYPAGQVITLERNEAVQLVESEEPEALTQG